MAEEDVPSELVPVVEAAAAVELTELEEQARRFARDSRARSTWRLSESDFADFRTWCASRNPPVEPLPASPETVALYIADLAATHNPGLRIQDRDVGRGQRPVAG